MPYIDARKNGVLLEQTARQNYEGYTNKQVQKAVLDRTLLGLLGHPSAQDLEYLVIINNIYNCPITIHDVKNSHAILGPDIAGMRCKTVRNETYHIAIDYVAIPRDFPNMHNYVTIVADAMSVKNTPFLVTMSRGIKLITVEHIPTCTSKNPSKILKRMMHLYSNGSMIVKTF